MSDPCLPVVHSRVALPALTRTLSTAYGWTAGVRVTLLRSWTNDVYEVSSSNARYILKVYRATWRRPPQVQWEIELQQWLSEHGAPVAAVIPLVNGSLFGLLGAPEGTRCFALFRRAPGTKPSPPWTTGLYQDYGRGAALVHEASSGFSGLHARFEWTLENPLDESLAVIVPWLEGRPHDVISVHHAASTVRQHLVRLLPTLNWGICHGDLSLDNLHVQPDGQLTLYDFDASCYGWCAWDVSNAVGYTAGAPGRLPAGLPQHSPLLRRGAGDGSLFHGR